jgi:hypothetical protein
MAAILPDDDPFYQPPPGFESEAPGTVLKSRSITIQGPPFFPTPNINSWQLLFRSTDTKGNPIAAVTTIAVPKSPYGGAGERPLASYQMAIDGLGTQCNPSYTLQQGTQKELSVAAPLLERGWAANMPDFEGTQMHYGAGPIAAHVVLDSIRATYNFEPAAIGPSNPLGLAGYSGGGQATAWAVEQQPSYAPELDITAAAPGGVPADLDSVARANDGGPFMGLVLGAAIGVDRAYPEMGLSSLLNAAGTTAVQQMSGQCVEQFAVSHPFQNFSDFTKPEYPDPISLPQVQSVLQANGLPKATPTAPIYLWHSAADEIIPVASADLLASTYCSNGVNLTYQRGAEGDHNAYAAAGAPEAVSYLEAHFNGISPPSTCGINTSADTRIDSGPSGSTDTDSATFTYSEVPQIPGATFECKLDGSAFASCPASGITYTELSPGEHTFAVRSVTAAGNRDLTPATRIWRYFAGYARPKAATPASVPLVPAFKECASGNSSHGAPLAAPSCDPAAPASDYLTVGSPDTNGKPAASTGNLRLGVIGESPINPDNGDQADISITGSLTDVRNRSDLSDYTGELRAVLGLRVTDRLNGASLSSPATAEDTPFAFNFACSATATSTGGTCNVATTADAVTSGIAIEAKRSIWELGQVRVFDGGADGDADTTGDNTLFAVQGLFAP